MNDELASGIESLQVRASIAKIFIVLVAVSALVCLGGVIWYMQIDAFDDAYYIDNFHIVDMFLVAHIVFSLASWITVGAWIYRAHANLRAADFPSLEYSPVWAIGWYAIPIANLFKPFQAMRELWFASHGAVADYEQSAPPLLWAWWISWLLLNLTIFSEEYGALDIAGFAFTTVSAVCIFVILDRITKLQPEMSVASTFE